MSFILNVLILDCNLMVLFSGVVCNEWPLLILSQIRNLVINNNLFN